MIYTIPVPQNPNEVFSSFIGGNSFNFTIRTFKGLSYISIDIDNERVATGVRICPNTLLIDKGKDSKGNFMFYNSSDGTYPYYDNFGESCELVYIDAYSIAEYYTYANLYEKDSSSLGNWIEGKK